ncbi:MAG: DDE-type integrase/transposase/recombinase [Desulfobacteraceae bacterium]|nr:DDE-type integrase/transposase/recombinase [Desulfobacteraceae bacterium]
MTTNSNHNLKTSPDLVKRNFKPSKPNQIWTSDLTYVRTRSGWLYLCVILDLFSRKIIGWSMAENMQVIFLEKN